MACLVCFFFGMEKEEMKRVGSGSGSFFQVYICMFVLYHGTALLVAFLNTAQTEKNARVRVSFSDRLVVVVIYMFEWVMDFCLC